MMLYNHICRRACSTALSVTLKAVILLPILLFAGCGGESSVEPIEDFNRPSGLLVLTSERRDLQAEEPAFYLYDLERDVLSLPKNVPASGDDIRFPRFFRNGSFTLFDYSSSARSSGTPVAEILFFPSLQASPLRIPNRIGNISFSPNSVDISNDGRFLYVCDYKNDGSFSRIVEIRIRDQRARILVDSLAPDGRVLTRPGRNQILFFGFGQNMRDPKLLLFNTDGGLASDLTDLVDRRFRPISWSPNGRFVAGNSSFRELEEIAQIIDVDTRTVFIPFPSTDVSTVPGIWYPDSRSFVLFKWDPRDYDGTLASVHYDVLAGDTVAGIPNLGTKIVLISRSKNGRFLCYMDLSRIDLSNDNVPRSGISTIIYDRREQRVVKTIPGLLPGWTL